MPTWKELLNEIQSTGNVYDVQRRTYLKQLSELTGRNVIVYYSGWLQKGILAQKGYLGFGVGDNDKNGFMAAIHKLDREKGLDLFLHTPGGDLSATESLVDYLRSMFGSNIRAIVPQLAMSAGTMMALSCREIVMGKHSSLGPIDPQIGGMPAHGILEEFDQARNEIQMSPATIPLWQPIISKYSPTLIGACQKAIKWSDEIVEKWLVTGMFDGVEDASQKAKTVIAELGSHALTKSHARHISVEKAAEVGLKITRLEDDQALQDAVLSVHHACILSLSATEACKIIESNLGLAYVETFGGTQRS